MTAPLDTDVAIETPEHIVFHYRIAGPARRALAYVLDVILCYLGLFVLLLIVVFAAAGGAVAGDSLDGATKTGIGVVLLALFFVQWVYFVLWEGLYGRTPGKMALGLRVVTTSGRPIGLRAATLRNVVRAADVLPMGSLFLGIPQPAFAVGLLSIAMSRRFQRLGDLVAGTMVVVPERARATEPLALWPPAEPREVATLPDRVVLDEDERAAIELFLRRKHTIGRAREQELAGMVAGPIGARLGFRHADPSRLLALVYDRAVNEGRTEAPPSSLSRRPKKKREGGARSVPPGPPG